MTQTWLEQTDPKVTQKWLKRVFFESFLSLLWVFFESFLSHLGSLWGGALGVTFESLLGHFNPFWVSVKFAVRSCWGFLHMRCWMLAAEHPKKVSRKPSQAFWPGVSKSPHAPKRTHKAKKLHEQHQRTFWTIRGGYRSFSSKTWVLRQIAPESSPERLAKSLSHSFFVVPFLSPRKVLTQPLLSWDFLGTFLRPFQELFLSRISKPAVVWGARGSLDVFLFEAFCIQNSFRVITLKYALLR